jgi:hypothetical protein
VTIMHPLFSLAIPQQKLREIAQEIRKNNEREEEEERRRRRRGGQNQNNNNNNNNNSRMMMTTSSITTAVATTVVDNVKIEVFNQEQVWKLQFLTIDDLKKKAKPWREFFATDYLRKSYSIPKSRADLYVRFDRNVHEYLGNYRRCSWIIALALLYKKPKAIAGGIITLKLYDILQALGQSVAIQGTRKQVIQFFVQVLIWVVSIVTRVFASISMAVAVVFFVLGTHAIFRRLDAPRPNFKQGKRVSGVKWETNSPREINSAGRSSRGGFFRLLGKKTKPRT